ncbi:MAG TPA: hypothetical protein GX716_06245 [Firmicutes bacterium]|nr:hypothetical protein [Candidatus Fermentithermobacillaceae bacterium]
MDSPDRKPLNDMDIPEDEANVSLVREFLWFVRDNKKWWLVPMIVMFLLLAVVVVLGTNPAIAPFIYSLF